MDRKPFCRKCLWTKEMVEKELIKIENYIESISEDEKVDDAEYERRLLICEECSDRREGLCGQCGCYIAIRAVRKTGYCPHVRDKWNT